MNMSLQGNWFTELCPESHSAFSLEINKHCHHEKTSYQTIDIYDTKSFGHLMVIDGFIMLSERDNFFYHEMMSHVPLLTHPNPQNVVIVGGGDCGTLSECLSHPLQSITQVDIDERVTALSKQYFPKLCQKNSDPRASLLFEDGVAWMQKANDVSVDVIIVDSTDPIGPGEGLFNQAFYQQCHRVLRPNGLIVQQSESPLIHQDILQNMKQAMLKAGFESTLTYTFPQPVYPTGFWSATLASVGPMPTSFRKNDHAMEHVRYYCGSVHQACLQEVPMVKQLSGQLR